MSESFRDRQRHPYVRNDLSGNVDGPVVQAQEIHGGITFNVRTVGADDPVLRPDQMPPLTVWCVNHAEELSLLDSDLRAVLRGSSVIGFVVISGIPGVGKTTLACRWADTVRDRFPDGQIFIDYAALRRRAGGDVSAALVMCLRALGVHDAFMPESLEELTAHYRSRTAGRRILVVLDDANRPGQVLPLVPKGPGSALLVTSNGKLGELVALDGARPLPLEPLNMADGLRLLAQRCGEEAVEAERGAAERLVGFCAGLPKALQLVAARLLTSKRLTMSRLAEELADETRRLRGLSLRGEHSVSAVLDLTYRALPPDMARLYRVLGWLPVRTFDAGTAAVAACLDVAEAEALLDVLEESSLVDVTEDGRFRFHDLVRLHARERAAEAAEEEPEDGRQAVVERVATHYLALTAFADRAVREDRLRIGNLTGLLRDASDPFAAEGGPDPLAWLEAERAGILAVLREASGLGLHKHVWQLAEGFTVLFLHRRYLGDWKESLELGAAAAAEAVVPAAEARLRSLLSRPLMDLGECDRARAELEKAVACAEVSARAALKASVQEFFGRYWDRFDAVRAMEAYRRSVELNIEAGEWRGVAIATYFLGCAQDAAGRHDQALDTLRRAHQDLLARDDKRMAARALAAIGAVHDHKGDPDAAMRVLGEAADALRAEKASHYEAQALVLLADITERTGGAQETVREHVMRAHEIYETGGSPEAEKLRERLDRLGGAM
ncbi:NB-ARC domain-containing protein [Streptomyces turgidiscabies]|uniref:Tetratricopeptide (TPR) repeat protein n=1 Tax=Streptomyces turgidiscabies TaxID=85558 RepID=A0ABU0RQ19_9ACTN|nr:NB-ARC domain-containing protein [Streptomyces turgidiscabies]MDQ0934088.1 tetratricopeptide (TPR) repeat protein [Streptomyces turgidiscabies]